MSRQMTGAKMIVQALKDQGVTLSLATPAVLFSRSMMKSSCKMTFATILCVMSKALFTRQKDMPALQVSRVLSW